MKITIESDGVFNNNHSKVVIEEQPVIDINDVISMCEKALSAYFGYGIKIHEWETYICPEQEEDKDDATD